MSRLNKQLAKFEIVQHAAKWAVFPSLRHEQSLLSDVKRGEVFTAPGFQKSTACQSNPHLSKANPPDLVRSAFPLRLFPGPLDK